MASEERASVEPLGRILVVDDQSDVVNVVSLVFRIAGYEVASATDGRAALKLAETRRFDVVMLDIIMPGLDGVTVLQQMRLRWPDLPVVMLTAVADLERAKGAMEGFQSRSISLSKPSGSFSWPGAWPFQSVTSNCQMMCATIMASSRCRARRRAIASTKVRGSRLRY